MHKEPQNDLYTFIYLFIYVILNQLHFFNILKWKTMIKFT